MNGAQIYPYLVDGLRLLSGSLRFFREGEPAAYRAAAVQLRMLLCDTTRVHNRQVDISLAARLFPDLTFHPPYPDRPGFDLRGRRLSRADWLRERVVLTDGSAWTLREMIRWVCDRDGGAHVDPQAARPSGDIVDWIVAIGDYVVLVLDGLIKNKSIIPRD